MFPIINSSGVQKKLRNKFPVYVHLSWVTIFEEKPIEKKKAAHVGNTDMF